MPPRVRLSSDEAAQLPDLLAAVASRRADFPVDADPSHQARWVQTTYEIDSLNLTTLLLFEHGVHRSADQVALDLRDG